MGEGLRVPKLVSNNKCYVDDVGLWELNKAFAVRDKVYCRDRLGIPEDRLPSTAG